MSRVSGNRCRITWRITSGEIGELISKTISPLAASPMAIGGVCCSAGCDLLSYCKTADRIDAYCAASDCEEPKCKSTDGNASDGQPAAGEKKSD